MVKNKKGISAMIGYILLVSFGIVMSVIVFNYLQTYVPKDSVMSCPDGTSMFMRDYSYNCSIEQLNISVKNNGKFNVAGFFIHGGNQTDQKIATVDFSKYLEDNEGRLYGSAVVVNLGQENLIVPNDESNYVFSGLPDGITIIEIIPMRFQEQNNKFRPISCTAAKIRETITCD